MKKYYILGAILSLSSSANPVFAQSSGGASVPISCRSGVQLMNAFRDFAIPGFFGPSLDIFGDPDVVVQAVLDDKSIFMDSNDGEVTETALTFTGREGGNTVSFFKDSGKAFANGGNLLNQACSLSITGQFDEITSAVLTIEGTDHRSGRSWFISWYVLFFV